MAISNKDKFAPEGSRYERLHPQQVPKSPLKRLRKLLSGFATLAACWTVPFLYRAWMGLVWRSSRVDGNFDAIRKEDTPNSGLVAAVWHRESLMAPHLFRDLNIYTLASTSRIGRVITSVLEKNGFRVFRGGTGEWKRGRRRSFAFRNMIYYLKRSPGTRCGIAVDGTRGPPGKIKPGIVKIAQACGVPVYLVSTSVRHSIRLPTWDRTILPLPFNQIQSRFIGPFWIEAGACAQKREAFRQHIENELTRLSEHNQEVLSGSSRVAPQVSIDPPKPFGSYDLQNQEKPPWAQHFGKTDPGIHPAESAV